MSSTESSSTERSPWLRPVGLGAAAALLLAGAWPLRLFVEAHIRDPRITVLSPVTLQTYLEEIFLQVDVVGLGATIVAWAGAVLLVASLASVVVTWDQVTFAVVLVAFTLYGMVRHIPRGLWHEFRCELLDREWEWESREVTYFGEHIGEVDHCSACGAARPHPGGM